MPIRDVIIDCDTGVDDALALLLALRHPELNVVGITTVAGNVTLDRVVPNTLKVVEHAGRTTPVYAGAAASLLGTTETAELIHGSDGLGDLGYPEAAARAHPQPAVDFLVETYLNAPNPPHLVTLAPLTNIALILQRVPALADRIPSITMMGGGVTAGNHSAAAEFNIAIDPEAADIVFRSNIPKFLVPLEPNDAGGAIYEADVERIPATGMPWNNMAAALLRSQIAMWSMLTGTPSPASPPDLAAMALFIDPTLGNGAKHHTAVELKGEHTRGMTVVDRRWYRHMAGAAEDNVFVYTELNNARYRGLVVSILGGN